LAIFQATVGVLQDVGYDRLTMDAVAQAARASKATLYRRWTSKAELVVEAICQTESVQLPKTGSLRGDLIALASGPGGLSHRNQHSVLAGLLTAMQRDQELAAMIRERLFTPKSIVVRGIFEQAQSRGELVPTADIDLLMQILPALAIHRVLVLGHSTTQEFVERIIDEVVLPACTRQSDSPLKD
jgi:AcrR family transcriptional regulator